MMGKHIFNKVGVVSAVAVLSANVAAFVPAEVKLGGSGIRMIPTLGIKQGFDDNVFATDADAQSSGKLEIIPEFKFISEKDDSAYEAGLLLSSTTYLDVDDADSVDWELSAGADQVITSRHRLKGKFAYGYYTEDKSFDAQPTLPQYAGLNLGLLYGFGAKTAKFNFEAYVDFNDKAYQDNIDEGKDSQDVDLGGIGYMGVAPATSALIELRSSDLGYTNAPTSDVEVFTALLGVVWDATAKTSGFAKIGQQEQSRVDGKSRTEPSWEVGVDWSPQTYSTLTFATEQSFGLESQSGEYTQYIRFGADWKHEWTPRWRTQLGLSFLDEDVLAGASANAIPGLEVGQSVVTRQMQQLNVDVTYDMNRWSELSGGYAFTDRGISDADPSRADFLLNSDVYTRNYFYVAVNLSL